MRKFFALFVLVITFTIGCAIAQAATWTVPVVNMYSVTNVSPQQVSYWAAKHKAYFAYFSYSMSTMGLLVYDTDANGLVSGTPRWYRLMPTDSTSFFTVPWSMLLNTRDSKLYIGLRSNDVGNTTDLTMYSLDANGEPTGAPQAFSSGNPSYYVTGMVLHPTLDRLYCVGYNANVYVRSLTTDGIPTGAPITITVGADDYPCVSLSFNPPNSNKLYLGAYSKIYCMDLDASGNKTGTTRSYNDVAYVDYLWISAAKEGVYFRKNTTGNLSYWDVTTADEPTGNVVNTTRSIQTNPIASSDGDLCLVEPVKFTDVINGTTNILSGFKVSEYGLTTAGAVSTVQYNTLTTVDTYDRQQCYAMNAQPNTIVTAHGLSLPLGNRIKDLSVRYTLNSIDMNGDYSASTKEKDFGTTAEYYRFAYSARWGKIFGVNKATAKIKTYNIAADTFAADITATTPTTVMAIDDNQTTYGRLYNIRTNNSVDYRNLNSAGVPGTATNKATGMTSIGFIAVNTVQHKVYLIGLGGTAGVITGTEIYKCPTSIYGYITDAVVDDTLHKLYVVTYYEGTSNLFIWNLNADGSLNGSTPTQYADGFPLGGGSQILVEGVRVNPAHTKLYLCGNSDTATASIVVQDLNTSGLPNGTINVINPRHYNGWLYKLELSSDGTRLYYTADGVYGVLSVSLGANGLPSPGAVFDNWTGGSYASEGMLIRAADGSKLFGGMYDSNLLVMDMSGGKGSPAPTGMIGIGALQTTLPSLKIGVSSPWYSMNAGLTGVTDDQYGRIKLDGDINSMQVKLDFTTNGGSSVLDTFTQDAVGNLLSFFASGYDAKASVVANYAANIKSSNEQYIKYDSNITTPVVNRPSNFVIVDAFSYPDGNATTLGTGMDVMRDMGRNTVMAQQADFASKYIGSTVHTAANNNGITKFSYGANIESYFAYNTELFAQPHLNDRIDSTIMFWLTNEMGAAPNEVSMIHEGDEPGWYYPNEMNLLDADIDAHKQVFKDYLYSINTSAAWFGLTNWTLANVHCGRQSDIDTTAKRRLFYWTTRFFAETNANAFAAYTTAVVAKTNPSVLTTTNLNDFLNDWFVPHPGMVYGNNFDATADACSQYPDWFHLGRKNAITCLWSEDWFQDPMSQDWSLQADLLRCAARNSTNGMKFGGYIVGNCTGEVKDGTTYKLLSMVGHGAKASQIWQLGPSMSMPADGYSENPPVFQASADAIDMLGKKESVLYPGLPRNGTVAILVPIAAQVWDGTYDGQLKYHHHEIEGLYYALTHANYPVDFVDDFDIENGKLATYGYKTLYVAAPNLSVTAQTNINSWVNAGGTCVVLPGAARADQYNDATTTMYAQLGCTQAAVSRLGTPIATWQTNTKYTIDVLPAYESALGATDAITYMQIAPLTVTTGTSLATVDTGSAIVLKTYGSGRYMTYGFWPGNEYWITADKVSRGNVFTGYEANTRSLIVAPAGPNYGNAKKFAASSAPMVETALLENAASGIGIVLLNWSGASVPSTTISVNKLSMPTAILNAVNAAISGGTLVVNSIKQGNLSYTVVGNDINITLPVNTVDVLTLTW